MERFTQRMPGGYGLADGYKINDLRSMRAVVDRLAAYEDTGLKPEDIELLAKQRDRYVDACGELPLKRIRELAQADREGRVKIEPKARKCPKCGKMRLFQRIDWEYYYCYSCKTQFTSKEVETALRREQDG